MTGIKFSIDTLGCKVNQSESDFIAGKLQKKGFKLASHDRGPDFCIVNTCTVTSQSDRKVRQLVRRIKSENKDSKLIVTGCFVVLNKDFLRESGVDFAVKNKDKDRIPDLIEKEVLKWKAGNGRNRFKGGAAPPPEMMHSRPVVKVQDGCEQNCTYCIIPKVRGGYRSVPYGEVLRVIRELEEDNFEEAVLTGINIGKYGVDFTGRRPEGKNRVRDFKGLIEGITGDTGIKRIRISSIEVDDIDDGLLDVLKRNEPRIACHLHVPLQSGSSKILKLMGRPYDADYYLEKVKKIRKFFPDIALTTDVMVGFPDEDNYDFDMTVDMVREAAFSKVHVFKFSKRKYTSAYRMPRQVDEKIKSERSRALREIGGKLRESYLERNLGRELEVVCEKMAGGNTVKGTSGNYIKVYFKMDEKKLSKFKGKIVRVRADSVFRNGLSGNMP
ncbi:MAG: tRNA (N(6)-L-threonylcarbamoyladenosine(37)-C(2))-methylthiotransferase MtaB [Actinomycetota bacterium]|nr:tRNA (N(6)-L-threonylcarbamoyladenosine(37)-C(2))-methylthiotransferase MtaB [Actinomycetota bacterium]